MAPIIAVTGHIAAGKTTFIRQLSAATNIPYIQIDTFDGDWTQFQHIAVNWRGSLLTESVALPIWRDVLIYCLCDEQVRQRRLDGRECPREPLERYDYRRRADLVVDTTGELDLVPAFAVLRRI